MEVTFKAGPTTTYYKNDNDFARILPDGKLIKISFCKNNIYVSLSKNVLLINAVKKLFVPCDETEFNAIYQKAIEKLNEQVPPHIRD